MDMHTKLFPLKKYIQILTLLCVFIDPLCSYADDKKIVIVYPEIQEPYRSIFSEIIKGINTELNTTIPNYAVPKRHTTSESHNWIKRNNGKVIIALGQRGFRASHTITPPLPLVLGAVMAAPTDTDSELVTISYAPDPTQLFERLKILSPSVNTVHTVYNPEKNNWLVEIGKKSAKKLGINLKVYEASDFRESATLYKKILQSAESNKDAIWIIQDSTTLDERVILPLILEQSWKRKLVVFSSNLSHANKGVLFSLYPDNYNLGRRLGRIAKKISRNQQYTFKLQPLQDVRIAVNIRTAKHLGLSISYKQQRAFDLIFPKH